MLLIAKMGIARALETISINVVCEGSAAFDTVSSHRDEILASCFFCTTFKSAPFN